MSPKVERVETIVVGGGQAGLAVGYHLARRGLPFLILDAHQRVGDAWRARWDSLRLFTPARFDALPGMPFPAPAHSFPTKDELADYLEGYARHFELPLRTGVRVDRLRRDADRFVLTAGDACFEADNVVIAMSNWQEPRVPTFAKQLRPDVLQLHSSQYRNPAQLRAGGVLIVGAGNSGAEIAMDVAADHPTWLSGRDTGNLPFRIDGPVARIVLRPLFRVVFHRLLTTGTPFGRKVGAKMLSHGMPLLRIRPHDLAALKIERVARVTGVRDGRPLLEDERTLDVQNVIWCTGFEPGFSWIDLPLTPDDLPVTRDGWPAHQRGAVAAQPGLYFVGLAFLYAASSAMIHGVERDAAHITSAIAARRRAAISHPNLQLSPVS